jgi:hypothetical protein
VTVPVILLGACACILTSLACGLLAVRLLKLDLNRAESLCLGYVLGGALTSLLTLAVAVARTALKGVFFTIAALALVLLWHELRLLRARTPASFASIPRWAAILLAAGLIAYGIIYFRQALSPEISPDGAHYHLGLVNLWAHAHGLAHNISMYAALPQGVEMLFLFAFSIGRHSAAALVHLSFLLILPWLMILYGMRFGWSGGTPVVAALLVFADPLVGVDGSVAYNDVALAAVVFAAVYLIQTWRESRHFGALLAASFLGGFAVSIKYSAVSVAVLLLATILWETRSALRASTRIILAACAAMAAPVAPYIIRNVVWFANPIAFFGNSIFRNPWFHVSAERQYLYYMSWMNGMTWPQLPWEFTVGGTHMSEAYGPVFLLLLALAVPGLFWRRTRYLVVASVAVGLALFGNKFARFVLPAIPLLAMVATYVLSRIPRSPVLLGSIAISHMVVSWPAVIDRTGIPHSWRLSPTPWGAALRREPEDHYLAMASPDYLMARFVEMRVPAGQQVLALWGGAAQSYTTRPILVSWESAFAEKMSDVLVCASRTPFVRQHQCVYRWTPVQARAVEFTRSGRDPRQMWSMNEIRLWNGSTLLRRTPDWRVDAFPNPWDAGDAFDGIDVTRWRSWEPVRPGMFIRLQLGKPALIDRIEVLNTDQQALDEVQVRILDDYAKWVAPSSSEQHDAAPEDLRREATRQLRNAGVGYLLTISGGGDWTDRFLLGKESEWSMSKVVVVGDRTLYKID